MVEWVLKKIFGTQNERRIKKLRPIVEAINALEEDVKKLSNQELQDKTKYFLDQLAGGKSLNDLLVEAFAVVREVSRRTLNMRHFDVQLMGGVVLHRGMIAEMKTGEGKTLVATLPIYLNALERDPQKPERGRGVHLVTVNDYLARRDALWMGPIYLFLGLSVGVINHEASYRVVWEDEGTFRTVLEPCSRKEAYDADVTYGTNNEFGFDYLRDNMKYSLDEMVQRELNYAIIDEVDSILIDEARTPLIISGPSEESTNLYYVIDRVVRKLRKEKDFTVDEKAHSVVLTEEGIKHAEKLLGVENLYDPRHVDLVHHLQQALRAHHLYKRDVDYIVKDGKVIIVDEFTGRLMPGRRWSDGLHQAVEAKEGVKIESENQTLATVTFQNFFRMYNKIAGMTGTAETEAMEFKKIYNLEVVVVPTNKPMIRKDFDDVVYKTEEEKFEAIVEKIKQLNALGIPVLVGTISIEKNELLSRLLKNEGIKHHVLNAKNHEREAMIIAQAGRKGAVTVATNMAGRGVDIMIGGNPEYLAREKVQKEGKPELYREYLEQYQKECEQEKEEILKIKAPELGIDRGGGLFVIGSERHESRRIDNQLRGRSGRQGDPGYTQFYLSLEDDLMRIFGGERLKRMMDRLGVQRGEEIRHRWVTKAIENAQARVEARNFEIRKHLLEYDDVMNRQRETIYSWRKDILSKDDLKEDFLDIVRDVVEMIAEDMANPDIPPQEWEWESIEDAVRSAFFFPYTRPEVDRAFTVEDLAEDIYKKALEVYETKESTFGADVMRRVEKFIMLQTIDSNWKDHLLALDHLREGIGLRGYAQRDPLIEYKREAFHMFEAMVDRVKMDIVKKLFLVQITSQEEAERISPLRRQPAQLQYSGGEASAQPAKGTVKKKHKIGRNDPCPCGSGKKYKKCCGRVA